MGDAFHCGVVVGVLGGNGGGVGLNSAEYLPPPQSKLFLEPFQIDVDIRLNPLFQSLTMLLTLLKRYA